MVKQREPKYWGSWKGRVIKAIVIDGAKKWNEIRELTGLSKNSLNRALMELYNLEILKKENDDYFIAPETGRDYENFSETQKNGNGIKFQEGKNRKLIAWIDDWKKVKCLDFSMDHNHFYLKGRHLDELSKELITRAESEVLVVNPFVNQCDLSDTLRQTSNRGIKVRLITRPPEESKLNFRKMKEEYHSALKQEGVTLTYNRQVHAKLIVIDRALAILSSMNFYSGSSGGASWEAGIVTLDENVVEPIIDSILELLERPETTEM